MTTLDLANPDTAFLRRLINEGGGDVKKCFQCATCSTCCELSSDDNPFPRQQMIWAQWGLKDRLVSDPRIWLCHQCNECTTRCPRGARPGDVLAAARHECIAHYSVPRFLATLVNDIKLVPLSLLIGVVLLLLVLLIRDPLEQILPVTTHHEFYAQFFPHWLLIGSFNTFTGLAFIALIIGLARFWRSMKAADLKAGRSMENQVGISAAVFRVIKSILFHDRFGRCARPQASKQSTHLLAFYGFAALFIVTIWAVFDLYVFPLVGIESQYPFNLMHPLKILANVGAALLFIGCLKAIIDRARHPKEAGTTTAFDSMFVWLLLIVTGTGLLTEVLRFVAEPGVLDAAERDGLTMLSSIGYTVYFVHLVFVFQLLVYWPFSKFAHVFYRTIAMIYAERYGRGLGGAGKPNPGVLHSAAADMV